MENYTRAFVPGDYPALVEIINAAWPAYPTTVEQLSIQDTAALRHPEAGFHRYVVEHAGKIIGFGHYEQPLRFYEPGRFRVQIFVHPRYQKQGVGSHLHKQLMDDLCGLQAYYAWTRIRDDMVDSVRFVKRHGFLEELRIWECRLDVALFDSAPFTELTTDLKMQGIEIKSLRELESDVTRNQKVYELFRELGRDLPPTEHWTEPDYKDFQEDLAGRSPEAYFIALHEQHYIGLSYLTEHRAEQYCATGLTGVRRSYRRRGIALALKLRGIIHAKQHGYPTIRTSVDSANTASLALNEQLGFVKQPAWIVFLTSVKDRRPQEKSAHDV